MMQSRSRGGRAESGVALLVSLFMMAWLSALSGALAQEIVLGVRINRYAGLAAGYHQVAQSALTQGRLRLHALTGFTPPQPQVALIELGGVRIYNAKAADYFWTRALYHTLPDQEGFGSGYLLEYLNEVPVTAEDLGALSGADDTVSASLFRVTAFATSRSGQPVVLLQLIYKKLFQEGGEVSTPGLIRAFRDLPADRL